MRKGRPPNTPDVPRPLCACGNPGEYQVELTVRKLELERDSGVRSEAYWMASYRNTVANIQSIVCAGCYAAKVNVNVLVSATVEKATEKP